MRIAEVGPLYESVPPKLYGGTERVLSFLTEELVRLGHEVTLFASGDSQTAARLIPGCERSLRLDPQAVDSLASHFVMLEEVVRRAPEFDVIHYHVDYLHCPFSRRHQTPHVTTLHGRLDIPELQAIYREYATVPVVSISGRAAGADPLCQLGLHGPPRAARGAAAGRVAARGGTWRSSVASPRRRAPIGPSPSPAPRACR